MRAAQRVLFACALIAAAAASSPALLSAQDVPTDTAAALYGIALELEAEGRTELATALFELILERYHASAAVAAAERRLIAMREERVDGSGRTELLVWSTLYGLWLGAAVPATFEADSPEPYGLGLLLGGPAGFLLSRAYAASTPVSEGQARAITFGGTWGTWQGFGWREALDVGEEEECTVFQGTEECFESGEDATTIFASMVLGGLAGIATGGALARANDISPGTATLINFGALWGTWYGGVAAVLADQDATDTVFTFLLLGGDAGLLATALLAPDWDMSRSRARLINIAGVAGLLGGLGVDLIVQSDNDKVNFLIPAVTSATGLALGASWTRDHDAATRRPGPEPGRGALIDLRDGALSIDVPVPTPVLLRAPGGTAARRETGVRLMLFQARF